MADVAPSLMLRPKETAAIYSLSINWSSLSLLGHCVGLKDVAP